MTGKNLIYTKNNVISLVTMLSFLFLKINF
jgi:hypothetical protein